MHMRVHSTYTHIRTATRTVAMLTDAAKRITKYAHKQTHVHTRAHTTHTHKKFPQTRTHLTHTHSRHTLMRALRQAQVEKGKALAAVNGYKFCRTSAKSGQNVFKAVKHISREIIEDRVKAGTSTSSNTQPLLTDSQQPRAR